MAIVEAKVKPERAKLTKNAIGKKRATYWWQFGSPAKELYVAIASLERVLVIARVTRWPVFTFVSSRLVINEKTVVVSTDSTAVFAVLSSRLHEEWISAFSSTLGDTINYAPTDCFQTFPFPKNLQIHTALEAVGMAYYEFRTALMVRNNEGLTKTYNRFHDPDERDPDILKLRELHAAMDRAVLNAYGWSDIPTACEFLLDYVIDEEEESSRRKKPWRYRWPDDVRDEVLARLLELNAARAAEEARTGATATRKRRRRSAPRRARVAAPTGDLFS